MMNRKTFIWKLFGLLLAPCSIMADSQLDFSVGYEKTSGDYGLENTTDITSIPFVVQYVDNDWRLMLSVPYISVTGDGSIIPGITGVVKSDSSITTTMGSGSGSTSTVDTVDTNSGLGDITSSVSYAFMPLNSEMFYELTASVKWGTASVRQGLGSGENDYSVSLYSLYDKHEVKPFINIGYLFIGDIGVTNYDDVFFASTGFMYSLKPQTSFSIIYDYQQATTNSTDEAQSLSLYANQRFSKQWSASAFLFSGLTDSVADTGIGLSLIHSF